jgi:hypothetical protein
MGGRAVEMPAEVWPLVRQFASNSFKYLFRHGDEVGDLLRWRAPRIAERIDFARMQAQPDTFVTPTFSALATDVLLQAPLRGGAAGDQVDVWVLIENQAEPEAIMSFRALRYVVMVYEQQLQRWMQSHADTRAFLFHPVLPVVFYHGTRTWEALPPMRSLVQEGDLFGRRIPAIEPVFVNLATTSEDVLRSRVGMLGWVLWLTRQSKRKRGFGEVLRSVVRHVDELPAGPGSRWERLLWYARALVYNGREADEAARLAEHIREAVRDERKAEAEEMSKTIAEAIGEASAARALRQALLDMLELRFKKIPESVRDTIEQTHSIERLEGWMRAFATARKLSDIPFNDPA